MAKEQGRLTFFFITPALQEMEKKILEITGLKRVAYHRKAIKRYIEQPDPGLNARLKIRSWSSPKYVKRNAKEPVYLTEAEYQALGRIAEKYHTKKTVIFMQALLEYTVIQAELLGLDKEI